MAGHTLDTNRTILSRRGLVRSSGLAALGIAATGFVSACAGPPAVSEKGAGAQKKTVRSQLLGSWRMIDWKVFRGKQVLDPPLGPVSECAGLLMYTPEGTMSANLTHKDRKPFADGSLDGGTKEERARAFASIISYTGTFDVDEGTGTVTHHVEIATFPNFVGKKLQRKCIFTDPGTLKLDTPPMNIGGEELASYILWRRTG